MVSPQVAIEGHETHIDTEYVDAGSGEMHTPPRLHHLTSMGNACLTPLTLDYCKLGPAEFMPVTWLTRLWRLSLQGNAIDDELGESCDIWNAVF